VERHALTGEQALVIEQAGNVCVGVVVQQAIDLGDDGVWRLP